MLSDRQLPLVRRLVHCLRFSSLLGECKWKRVGPDAVAELVGVLEQAARESASHWFAVRQPPSLSGWRPNPPAPLKPVQADIDQNFNQNFERRKYHA